MRPSRQFRPQAVGALEERAVPSTLPHLGMFASLRAGLASHEQFTTTFYDGSTQTDDRQVVPSSTDPTVTTTTDTIQLRNGGGQETVVDVATRVGNTTSHKITTTLPNGSVENGTRTDVKQGHWTTFNGSTSLANGGLKTFYGRSVQCGPRTLTVETVNQTGLATQHVRSITVRQGPFNQADKVKTIWPDRSVEVLKSHTTGVRL